MQRIILCLSLALLPVFGSMAAAVEDPAGLAEMRSAAERGDPEAMLDLAILYEFGFRLKDHNAPALAWYRLAADAGNAKASARHDALKAKVGSKEIEEANKLYTELMLTVKKPVPVAAEAPLITEPALTDTPKEIPSSVPK